VYRCVPLTVLVTCLMLVSACDGTPRLSGPTMAPTGTPLAIASGKPSPTAPDLASDPAQSSSGPLSPATGEPLSLHVGELFATAGVCTACHIGSVDEAGNDVSNGEYWRSTMMANAARDPYYLAGVSTNAAEYPEYAAAIEAKCSTCHAPMAHVTDSAAGREGVLLGSDGYLDPAHPLGALARDGVSCTTCHQIRDEGLGTFESFSGGGVFDTETPIGTRVVYGPYEPHPASIHMMSRHSGFIPEQSEHVRQSELCATCHNLYTQYVTEDGTLSEDWFPEQTPFTEWLASDHATETSCQSCHMPPAKGSVVLSNMGPAVPREPYAKHSFVGGNAYMLGMLRDFGAELGVQAGVDHFDATIARVTKQLQSQTAEVSISPVALEGADLSFDVTTQIWTGHKFPTGYPSRRAWLHVTVLDGEGGVVFESGGYGPDGAIEGNDNDVDGLTFEPHYDQISNPGQVQVYESVMHDARGEATTVLLAAAGYLKDNRLLPAGFDKTEVQVDIAPQGAAASDDDFAGGGDTVTYLIDKGDAEGPFAVTVELLYQTIAYRWSHDIDAYDTPEAVDFARYADALPNVPVVVAAQTLQTD